MVYTIAFSFLACGELHVVAVYSKFGWRPLSSQSSVMLRNKMLYEPSCPSGRSLLRFSVA